MLIPNLRVRGAAEAIEFYKKAFGAVEVERLVNPDGTIPNAQIKIGDAILFLADESADKSIASPVTLGGTTVALDLMVDNVDALVERALAAGAKLIFPVKDQFYGLRQGRIGDPFGHIWVIGTPIETVTPEEMQRRYDSQMQQ